MLHHIDVHVRDLGSVRRLFDALAPHVGYRKLPEEPDFCGYETSDGGRPRIGLIADADRRAGTIRLAFSVSSRALVDAAARAAIEGGACAIEGPAVHVEYGDYYAVFFEDCEGNRYEILSTL